MGPFEQQVESVGRLHEDTPKLKPADTFTVTGNTMLGRLEPGGTYVVVGYIKNRDSYSIRPTTRQGLRPVRFGFSHRYYDVDRWIGISIEPTGRNEKLYRVLNSPDMS